MPCDDNHDGCYQQGGEMEIKMQNSARFHVKKQTLLAIAGSVWLVAGFNVTSMGILAYLSLPSLKIIYLILSMTVFGIFGVMFYNMSMKHTKRILAYEQPTQPFWHFFDLKSYLIMVVMMSDGIWLRASGKVPTYFIVFFTQASGSP